MHLAAQARVAGGDLGARRAGADDRQAGGQLGQRPRLLGADHAAAELDAGDRPGDRAGGEDHAAGAVGRLLADAHVAVGGQRGVALDQVDLVFLEQSRRRRR